VIITGGRGLIGQALARELVGHGYQVIVLSRQLPIFFPNDQPENISYEMWDGRSPQGWGRLAEGARAIVNLAGENLSAGRWSAARKQRIRDSRVNAGQAVLQAVRQARRKPEVVVQASAVGYYGPCGDQELTEEAPPGNDFLAKVCVDWEASTAPVAGLKVRHVVIRTGVVLDAEAGALPDMALPFRLFVGGRLGSGRQYVPWIHLADEVAAIRFLIEHAKASGPFNLTAPQPLTNAEFGRTLSKVLRRPYWLPVPAFALRLLLGEMSTVVLNGQRAVPQRLLQLGFSFQFPDAEAALRDLLA